MFYPKTLEKEEQRRNREAKKEQKKQEQKTWKKIKARGDLTTLEKELLMSLMTKDFIQTTPLKIKFEKEYQSLLEKGYCHKLDDSHTFYSEEPITREEAEKMAMEQGWKKE